MRIQLRAFAALIGIAAVVLGAQWYLTVTSGLSLTNVDTFIQSMKSVTIASVVISGGLWVSVKAIFP